ncbi:MAG: hypothetical protein WCE44_06595 [Candidatus Velthaea sp.]
MKIQFSAADGTQDHAFSMDLEPTQFRGGRSAFGAYVLVIGLVEYNPAKARPLQIGGALSWPGDGGFGLVIPHQPASGGTTALMAPISDAQLASIEERRAGGEPTFEITLTSLAERADGLTASYKSSWAPQALSVPRDRWNDVLAACGYGRVHIVELPVPPDVNDAWLRSAQMLARASAEFDNGRYGEAMGNSRNSLQELVAVLERNLAIEPATTAFAPRVKAVGAELSRRHRRHGGDPYQVLASVIGAVFDFASEPVHRGYDVPNRDDAMFALSLASALHAFLARRPITSLLSDAEVMTESDETEC